MTSLRIWLAVMFTASIAAILTSAYWIIEWNDWFKASLVVFMGVGGIVMCCCGWWLIRYQRRLDAASE